MNKKNLDDCPDYLREFLFYMETIKGRSPRTVDGYYIDLRSFFRFLKIKHGLASSEDSYAEIKIGDLPFEMVKAVTRFDAMEFLSEFQRNHDNQAKARSRKVSALRSFYKYLSVSTGKIAEDPMRNLETPSLKKSLPKYLTLEQALELLTHIQTDFTERDYCMITLFLNCGMRLSELVGINLSDIRENRLKLLGKGNKERIVYLNEACLAAIDNYLGVLNSGAKVKRADKNALFLNRSGKRIGARRVEQIVNNCLKEAGLDGMGYSPHKLRHTAATLLYQDAGVDIRVLQEMLGHVSLSTTEIYTHVSNRQIEEAVTKSPLRNVKPEKTPEKNPEIEEKPSPEDSGNSENTENTEEESTD
ncbi:MAG TPA: tyrosine recombinase XerC [Oscillospiraceae bacterium]|nr:tyrosine recombinase XerC [Oscillospiraceae bacterium]HXK76962.1 tyrosine recombinase XerC [Oscillospiraceae bacterium]